MTVDVMDDDTHGAGALQNTVPGLVEAIQVLQRPRQHQARLRGGDAEPERAAGGRFRFRGMAEIALRGGEVVPADAVLRIRRQRAAQARGVGSTVRCHHPTVKKP